MKLSLKAARVNADLTQKQAAEKIGKDPMTLSNWESGKTKPKADDLCMLANIYHVEIGDFILQ